MAALTESRLRLPVLLAAIGVQAWARMRARSQPAATLEKGDRTRTCKLDPDRST